MATQGNETNASGWPAREEPPAGYPEVQLIQLAPLIEELEAMKQFVRMAQVINPDGEEARVMDWLNGRIRRALWEASRMPEEKTPETLAPMLDVSPDTVRYWCRKNYVKHRQTKGGHYYVDVESALEYVATR